MSSATTPSNATVVVDLPSLDVVACLSQAHAPILALAARITFRRRSSSDPVASVVVFRFLVELLGGPPTHKLISLNNLYGVQS